MVSHDHVTVVTSCNCHVMDGWGRSAFTLTKRSRWDILPVVETEKNILSQVEYMKQFWQASGNALVSQAYSCMCQNLRHLMSRGIHISAEKLSLNCVSDF